MNGVSTRFVRLSQIVGSKRAKPPEPGMIPLSAASIWRMVKAGEFPAPVKLGPNSTAWRLSDVEEWAASRTTAA